MAKGDKALRDHVLYLLRGGGAHVDFEKAVADFPTQLCSVKLAGVPYTAWSLVEHLRIAQWDILEFSRNAGQLYATTFSTFFVEAGRMSISRKPSPIFLPNSAA